jgi:hypothetical protein
MIQSHHSKNFLIFFLNWALQITLLYYIIEKISKTSNSLLYNMPHCSPVYFGLVLKNPEDISHFQNVFFYWARYVKYQNPNSHLQIISQEKIPYFNSFKFCDHPYTDLYSKNLPTLKFCYLDQKYLPT